MAKAVVLLSGGLDSATALAEARAGGFELYALTVVYGQRHAVEREAARRVARRSGVARHVELTIDLRAFGGSALTDDIEVPKDRSAEAMATGIPITYVPARNTVFLSLALAWAETLGAFDLFVGVNCVDYSGYPDCRPEYLRAFEAHGQPGDQGGRRGDGHGSGSTPRCCTLTKEQIIRRGRELGVDYGLTHSCYDPTARRPRLRPLRLVHRSASRPSPGSAWPTRSPMPMGIHREVRHRLRSRLARHPLRSNHERPGVAQGADPRAGGSATRSRPTIPAWPSGGPGTTAGSSSPTIC